MSDADSIAIHQYLASTIYLNGLSENDFICAAKIDMMINI